VFRNILAIFTTAALVIALSDPLIRAAPPLPLQNMCCGSTSDLCCGCILNAGANTYYQAPATNTFEECTQAPISTVPTFLCDQRTFDCVNEVNAQLYAAKNGVGCSSTCATPAGRGNVAFTVTQCLYTYGGCD
jgi:hypothetical protein